jgi:tryptophan 2,3-dioxygenase
MGLIVSRLQRVIEIQKLLLDQIHIMETMTPLDFLDFRDLLIPASGFQSAQFRTLEAKLGLLRTQRLQYNNSDFDKALPQNQRDAIASVESDVNLFTAVEKWLERTPFLKIQGFDFWQTYKARVEQTLLEDLKIINENPGLTPENKARNQQILEGSLKSFRALFDEKSFNEARKNGEWRLSYQAIHAALLIQMYRDYPVLQLPFRLLTALQDLDENMTNWRYRHALMAKRMLGSKVGTGGSSGAQYLRDATEQHKIFSDLFQLTTFFIPRSKIPPLPPQVSKELGFYYSNSGNV